MKNGFRMILALIMIICGFGYMIDQNELNLSNINTYSNKFDTKNDIHIVKSNGEITSQELILVNSKYGVDKNYKPKDLGIPNIEFTDEAINEEKYLAGIVIEPLEELIKAARDEGLILVGNSAYRSYETQKKTYNNRVKSQGKKEADAYVAKPGYSEHQTGLCIDITNQDRWFVKGTKEADWLDANCYKFGFIIRYPYGKKDITGIEYEPWHIRYVGKDSAKYIYDNSITLEEYLEQ